MILRTTERVIVSGGTSGIGRAIAIRLAGRARAIGVMGRRIEAADQVAAEIRQTGCEAVVLVADVGKAPQVESAVNDFIAAQGGLDTVVSSAGITLTMPVKDFGVSDWKRIVATNLSGTFYFANTATSLARIKGYIHSDKFRRWYPRGTRIWSVLRHKARCHRTD